MPAVDGIILKQLNQPVRVRVGERLQQNRINETEDGGVCANAQGERHPGHRREARALDQLTKRKFEIIHNTMTPCDPSGSFHYWNNFEISEPPIGTITYPQPDFSLQPGIEKLHRQSRLL